MTSHSTHDIILRIVKLMFFFIQVNGAWSRWSEFSPCSVTCSYGTRVRLRTCTEPVPANNGADCTGPRVEDEECYMGPCKGL